MIKAEEFLRDQKIRSSKNLIRTPQVSIIMPTYCRGDNGLLASAINSVLAQSFSSFELIIVDDGSVDETRNVVSDYLEKDNRIVYIRNEINSGMPALRVNQGLMIARGKYIAYEFDDDTWTKNALEVLVNRIKQQEGPSLVYGKCHISSSQQEGYVGRQFDYSSLITDNFIANNAVLHSRELFELYGMYDCHLVMRRLCDWDLWVRWAKMVPFIYVDEITSIVTAEVENSLGRTVNLRFDIVRKRMGVQRNEILKPEHFRDYTIDDLDYIPNDIEREMVFREFIQPWMVLHKRECVEDCDKNNDGRKRIICTKYSYDSSVSIILENYMELMKDKYNFVFFPDSQLEYEDLCDGDVFVIARSINEKTLKIVNLIKKGKKNIPILYLMDDNLFKYYSVDETAEYLKPGSSGYDTLVELVKKSDLIVTFSEENSEEIRRNYNPHVITAKTNILGNYISRNSNKIQSGPIKIAFMGGGARKNEFAEIEGDLIKLSKKYGAQIEFHFLGFIPEMMKTLRTSKVHYVPFSNAYYQYLNFINDKRFDILICPLYDREFNRSKSPIKFLEATCCGAVGVYSDVSTYECVVDGVTGYKVKWGESWYEKLSNIVEAGRGTLRKIYENACEFIKIEYTTESQSAFFDYMIKTAELHMILGTRVALFASHSCYCAGAESLLLRHCQLAKQAGANVLFALPESVRGVEGELVGMLHEAHIEIVYLPYNNYVEIIDCDFASAFEQGERIVEMLKDKSVGLIHNCTIIPALSYAANIMGIPQITSVYQGNDSRSYWLEDRSFAPTVIHSDSVRETSLWINKFKTLGMCIDNFIPNFFFDVHQKICRKTLKVGMLGTFQPRKNQLGAIKAVIQTFDHTKTEFFLYGYTNFYPDYFDSCVKEAKCSDINICFRGFVDSIIESFSIDGINVFLCASFEESIPQSMREAMAMGIPVVSTPAGNIPELIEDGITGYLAKGFTENDISEALERCFADIKTGAINNIINCAREKIRMKCSETNVALQLFSLYRQAFIIKESDFTCRDFDQPTIADQIVLPGEQLIPLEWNNMAYSGKIKRNRCYNIVGTKHSVNKIGLVFAAEPGKNRGRVQLRIFYDGMCLRESNKPIDALEYEKWTFFEFPELNWCDGKLFTVEISIEYEPKSKGVGVFENKNNRPFFYKVMNRLGLPLKGRNALLFCLNS